MVRVKGSLGQLSKLRPSRPQQKVILPASKPAAGWAVAARSGGLISAPPQWSSIPPFSTNKSFQEAFAKAEAGDTAIMAAPIRAAVGGMVAGRMGASGALCVVRTSGASALLHIADARSGRWTVARRRMGTDAKTPDGDEKKDTAKVAEKKSIRKRAKEMWEHIKHEAHHYWVGTKLLGSEIAICTRLLRQVMDGEELTRRELRQLRTTATDILKAVPFSFFILVPFMEFALPVALWLFPGMLPSTFKQQYKVEEDMKKQLRARIEVAKFLQSTVELMAMDIKKKSGTDKVTAEEFVTFMRRVREGDGSITNNDIKRYSKLFTDDITLDTIGRNQLVSLCRLVDITPFGSDAFLKYLLLQRIKAIKADDVMIQAEGVDSLTIHELREALAYRGMRASDLTKKRYQHELKSWLDISINKGLPTSLLLMSRAFRITADMSDDDALAQTLQGMSEQAIVSAEMNTVEEDVVEDKKRKLEELQYQKELIEKERLEKAEDLVLSAVGTYLEQSAPVFLLSVKVDDARLESEALRLMEIDAEARYDRAVADFKEKEKQAEIAELDKPDGAAEARSDVEVLKMPEKPSAPMQATKTWLMRARISLFEERMLQDIAKSATAELKQSKIKTQGILEDSWIQDIMHSQIRDNTVSLANRMVTASDAAKAAEMASAAYAEELQKQGTAEAAAAAAEPPAAAAAAAAAAAVAAKKAEEERKAASAASAAAEADAAERVAAVAAQIADSAKEAISEAEKEGEGSQSRAFTCASARLRVLSPEAMTDMAELLAVLSAKSATAAEAHKLKAIAESLKGMEETVEEGSDKIAKRMEGRISKMVKELEKDITMVENAIGDKFHFLDSDNDGIISVQEMKDVFKAVLKREPSEDKIQELIYAFDINNDGNIQVTELVEIYTSLMQKEQEMLDDAVTLKMPEILQKPLEELTDKETALYGSVLEEYRDKIREQRELATKEKNWERQRLEAEKARHDAKVAADEAEAAALAEKEREEREEMEKREGGEKKA